MSSSAGPNQTSSDLTDKCLCLKLLRILSKNICRGFFFLLAFSSSPETCEGKRSFRRVKFCCKYKN